MFIVMIHYKKSIEAIEFHLAEHREFLKKGFSKNYFIVAGPRVPREGGIIFSQLQDKARLVEFIQEDPFIKEGLVDYDIIEFNPTRCHSSFSVFMPKKEI